MIFTNKNLKYNYEKFSIKLNSSKSIWELLVNLVIIFTCNAKHNEFFVSK
jgi:hypothetical protein